MIPLDPPFASRRLVYTLLIVLAAGQVAGAAVVLIVARALMGIGGACIYPSTLSILTNTFHHDRERGRAMAQTAAKSDSGMVAVLGGDPADVQAAIERFGLTTVNDNGPGQVISSAHERPGSVSEPCAMNAPRQAATEQQIVPLTMNDGSPWTGRPRTSSSPVCRASASPSLTTRTM